MATMTPSRNGKASSTFTLQNLATKAKKQPNVITLHAKGGWGKTSFAAQIPGVAFLMVGYETGLLTLMDNKQIKEVPYFPDPAKTKDEIESALIAVANGGASAPKALAIDSLSTIEEILHQKCAADKYRDKSGGVDWLRFNSFDAGAKEAAKEWESIIDCIEHVRAAGISVILLGHAKVITFKNPEGPDYERWIGGTSKYSWERLFNWSDMVLFGDFEVTVDKLNDNKSDAKTKGKALGGDHRVLKTTYRAAYDAKHRHGLPDEIDGGDSAAECWGNFVNALKKQTA